MEEEINIKDKYPWVINVPDHLLPQINKIIGNLDGFYYSLQKNGHYLPERRSKAINGEYLWKVHTQ